MQTKLTENNVYPVIIQQTVNDWGGPKFTRKTTTVEVRYLSHEVQIEITITEHKYSGEIFEHHSSLFLPHNIAQKLGELLLTGEKQ